MQLDILGDLNWLAVLVATIAYFALGAIWYAQGVFGKAWMRGAGVTIPEGQRPGPEVFVVPLIANVLATITTAAIATATGSNTVGEGIVLGLMVGIGFAVGLTLLTAYLEQRPEPTTYLWVNSGYHIVGLVIVGIIVSVWT